LDEFKELHWFCPKCDKIAIEAICGFNPTSSSCDSMQQKVTNVISMAMQGLESVVNECFKKLESAFKGSQSGSVTQPEITTSSN